MVSSWSKHQSSSSSVSSASCWYCWSDSVALGLAHTPPRGDLLRTQQLVRVGTNCRLTYVSNNKLAAVYLLRLVFSLVYSVYLSFLFFYHTDLASCCIQE